jgi:hypothetical protein
MTFSNARNKSNLYIRNFLMGFFDNHTCYKKKSTTIVVKFICLHNKNCLEVAER